MHRLLRGDNTVMLTVRTMIDNQVGLFKQLAKLTSYRVCLGISPDPALCGDASLASSGIAHL